MTPLHLAAKSGHIKIVTYLCDDEADINIQNNDGVKSNVVYRARPILSLAGSWGRGVGKSERRSSRCY